MSDDERVVSLEAHLTKKQPAKKRAEPLSLHSDRIRDLAVKAVIYPGTLTSREAQELGSAVLSHIKQF